MAAIFNLFLILILCPSLYAQDQRELNQDSFKEVFEPLCQNQAGQLVLGQNKSTLMIGKRDKAHVFELPLLNELFSLKIDQRIIDLKMDQEKAYILTSNKVLSFSLVTGELISSVPSFQWPRAFKKYERPQGLALSKQHIIVAHGSLGLSLFQKSTLEPIDQFNIAIPQPAGHQSIISDVEFLNDNQFITAHDGVTLGGRGHFAFEGYALSNLEERRTIKAVPIKSHRESLSSPKIDTDKNQLIVNNSGIILSYQLDKLWKSKTAKPKRRFWISTEGIKPLGQLLWNKDYIFGCGRQQLRLSNGRSERKTLPLILKRSKYGL